jgi:hypothetical protein
MALGCWGNVTFRLARYAIQYSYAKRQPLWGFCGVVHFLHAGKLICFELHLESTSNTEDQCTRITSLCAGASL